MSDELREVSGRVRDIDERLIRVESTVSDLVRDTSATAIGVGRLVEIAEKKERREETAWTMEQEAKIARETMEAEARIASAQWWRENWKATIGVAVAVLLFLMAPEVFGAMVARYLGISE